MISQKVRTFEIDRTPEQLPGLGERKLDLVVLFTTPELTRTALEEANRLSTGLNAAIRVVKVQIVPFPLSISESPVSAAFQQEQLNQLCPENPPACEICYTREEENGLEKVLRRDSIVVLASPDRWWPTRTSRLAKKLRRAGHTVISVSGKENHA